MEVVSFASASSMLRVIAARASGANVPASNSISPVVSDPPRSRSVPPKRAARVAAKVLMNESGRTGIYYDDDGHPMVGSALVRDPKFTERVVAETRAFLSKASA